MTIYFQIGSDKAMMIGLSCLPGVRCVRLSGRATQGSGAKFEFIWKKNEIQDVLLLLQVKVADLIWG